MYRYCTRRLCFKKNCEYYYGCSPDGVEIVKWDAWEDFHGSEDSLCTTWDDTTVEVVPVEIEARISEHGLSSVVRSQADAILFPMGISADVKVHIRNI